MSHKLTAKDKKIVIVISDFNLPVTEKLLQGAKIAYTKHGGLENCLQVYHVPGVFEIPGIVNQILHHSNPDAIVALGAVIRGETPHFDYVAGESARGLAEISRMSDTPIINGILTTDNAGQAHARSVIGGRNKGWEAMEAALQTIAVYRDIKPAS